ncbi:tRNA glutamyl-Q(34) synthetase GluQRS [Acetobacter sp.]|jgi:glutamyl-Q tRNA(Asp) synthetase|uniref:tRNA glutamyl-Q(34) synthetase GluQRS n=1 Tax=Acetobacter sp. TaxID=440 RepID=UPI0025B9E47C|nr:tRNA glutamyl-Q(34) synthetase GluQRS [Acetobacter sp.]MCH4090692.1 tRNA glutamyl-Q(34) synthetase GluQRS [Acetobacter sp.]MCI1300135.1 tRNA glutamyl-Q(34) synthetase GluQRS [Acetobacter sp.]MCI1316553.1 tRNA glutamyl-Q(34) synthetase GluQRS [Acetobacter sp.]
MTPLFYKQDHWVTRFAPSPTGPLHLGHIAAAFFARRHAGHGGRFLLRIEDIDTVRCREVFIQEALDDLGWMGLHWEGDVLRQSERMPLYRQALDTLRQERLIYPCFCSRTDVAREAAAAFSAPHHAPDGSLLYPGTCRLLDDAERMRRITAGLPYALRLDVQKALDRLGTPSLTYQELGHGSVACHPGLFGDVILARRDTPASYHLCVTHDDAVQGVTLVTRGEELRDVTAVHRLLQELMKWPEPVYAFHPLLTDAAGRKLSKRDGALSIKAMRESGRSPENIKKVIADSHLI